jgi:hypothetical protein
MRLPVGIARSFSVICEIVQYVGVYVQIVTDAFM